MLHLFFRKDIPATYDISLLKTPASAIKDPATFRAGWIVLLLLLIGFFVLEPMGIPVSAIAASGAAVLFAVAKRGHAINTGKVLRGAPWQIVVFSLGMYLVVYGLRNAGLTEYLSGVLNLLAAKGLWAATFGTGILTAFLSSVMNNMPTVLIGALSIDGSTATGVVKEAMIYANVIGCDLGPKITPIGSSRNTLEMIRNSGNEPTIVYYLDTPPTRDELIKLISDMGIGVRELLRKNVEPYEQLGLGEEKFTDAQLIDFMLQHPILINRPIVVTPLGTRLCRPSEVVLDILPEDQKGVFTKEDGEKVIDETGKRVK